LVQFDKIGSGKVRRVFYREKNSDLTPFESGYFIRGKDACIPFAKHEKILKRRIGRINNARLKEPCREK